MKKLLTLTIWLVLAPLSICTATNDFFRNVDVKDGLADNFVRDITRDSHGYIWISTIHGLSRYDGYRFCNYLPTQFGGNTNDIYSVRETADSTLWMMAGNELYTYVRALNKWEKDGASRLAQMGVKGAMRLFYVDDRGHLWLTTDNGLYHYDFAQHKLYHIPNYSRSTITHIVSRSGTTLVITTDYHVYEVKLKDAHLANIAQIPSMSFSRDIRVYIDHAMNLWIYNSHSLAGTQWILSLRTRQWRQPDELKQMGNVFISTIAEDYEDNLWIGTDNDGIHAYTTHDGGQTWQSNLRFSPFQPRFSHINCFHIDANNIMWVGSAKLGVAFTDLDSPKFNIISTGEYEDVSAMAEDRHGNLWIGFDGGGIIMKTPTGAITHYSASSQQLPSDIVTSLTLHRDGSILAGTYGEGIVRFDGNRFAPLHPDDASLKYVKDLACESRGTLWVATVDNGVVRLMPEGKMEHYTSDNSLLRSNGTICLANDSLNDIMYIGTSTGLSVFDSKRGQFVEDHHLDSLNDVYITSLMVCSHSKLWIGSRQGLWVYDKKEGRLAHLTTEQGLSHNSVRALAMNKGLLWASTDNGMTLVTISGKEDGRTTYKCYPFTGTDGLHQVVFSNDAALITRQGTILLGCYSGYVSIPSEEITTRHPLFHVEFTEFRINGKPTVKDASHLTIEHDERLGIYLSAMLPSQKEKVRYLYRFKGEEEWLRSPDNLLFFATLRPGKHVLQVKAELAGMMESEISELTIQVNPPLLLSKPALLLYLIILCTLLYLLYKYSQRRQQRKLAIKQMEVNLKKYEMEEDKIRFFTNISHDLKTPLTLVVAPLEKIRDIHLPPSIRTEIDVAWRNARQLYDLVLQLLDFRRLDVGKEQLTLKHGDLVDFVRQTSQGFAYYATPKQIQLRLDLPHTPILADFDEHKMRRVITNLLSNAFKYNTDQGTVTVTLRMKEEEGHRLCLLEVADTGIGIHDKRHIFDRFVQESHGQEQEGSGIGLHIVKNYVDLMGGDIQVTDNKPKGTIFTITLPIGPDTGSTEEETIPVDNEAESDNGAVSALVPDHPDKPTLLVVDDNLDARLFLQRSLDDEYNIILAANGQEALDTMDKSEHIDLIVCDVMMPVMDGITFFRRIKSDINYSHIPVILLTAKSSEENIVAGLEEGVADYITKPYSLAVLRLRIRKVMEWTRQVHDQVATGVAIKPSEITVSSLDEELIRHAIADIEEHMDDSSYSVVQLSSAVGMTRGHLYKKLMAITGKSPLEFIRIIKLERGKSLLTQGRTNISEVADKVGLSPKQFSHYFKMMYGDTPSEYLKKLK